MPAPTEVTGRSWWGTSAGCISERLAIDSYKLGHSAFKTSSGSKYVRPILASVIWLFCYGYTLVRAVNIF